MFLQEELYRWEVYEINDENRCDIFLVGISYDKEDNNKKHHCVIEME